MKKKIAGLKKTFLGLVSGFAFVIIVWLLFFGRTKAIGMLSPFLKKIPKDESKLTEYTEEVLGKAAEMAKGGRLKKAVEKGSEFFESSEYAEPAREIRENVEERINEVIESVKELPAKEVRIIKRQVCKEWLMEEETATESAEE